nr:uncharacterized protein LOC112211309 [Halyomorpha halys]
MINARLRFNVHTEYKSAKVASFLSRLMLNVGGSRESRRRLLATVVSSIILYAAASWKNAMVTKSYWRQMFSVYRRVCLIKVSPFRNVSYEAVYVLARMPPEELLVEERSRHYGLRPHVSREDELKITIDQWQQRREAADSGRWTQANTRCWFVVWSPAWCDGGDSGARVFCLYSHCSGE